MLRRDEHNRYLDDLLETARFDDYAPNGLQVEGAEHISTLVTGVTASRALVDAALQAGAEALLVHHGYFWRGEDPRIVGMKRARLAPLLAHDIICSPIICRSTRMPTMATTCSSRACWNYRCWDVSARRRSSGCTARRRRLLPWTSSRATSNAASPARRSPSPAVRSSYGKSAGVPAPRRNGSRLPPRPGSTPSSPEKFPSTACTPRASWAFICSRRGTMPPSAMGSRRSVAISRSTSELRTCTSKSPIQYDPALSIY